MVNGTRQAGDQTRNRTGAKMRLSDEAKRILDTVLEPYCEWGDGRRRLISAIEDIVVRDLSQFTQ
jgi:hypothetical protein